MERRIRAHIFLRQAEVEVLREVEPGFDTDPDQTLRKAQLVLQRGDDSLGFEGSRDLVEHALVLGQNRADAVVNIGRFTPFQAPNGRSRRREQRRQPRPGQSRR